MLFIDRISETDGAVTRARLPFMFDDRDAATRGVESVIAGYAHHGFNGEQGYWWTRDATGQFKFVIV